MRNRITVIILSVCIGVMATVCSEENLDCSPGDISACTCSGGGEGVRSCRKDGTWGTCEKCEEGDACVPGKVSECPCGDGTNGTQECDDDGTWGPCEGCEEQLGECDYTACIGDICEEPEDCCENSGCNSFVFDADWGAIENYCYPLCDPEEEDPCKCDDVCLDFGNGFATCLPIGTVVIDNLRLPVGSDFDTSQLVVASEVSFEVELADESVPVDYFYAYWDEYEYEGSQMRDLIIRAEGVVDTDVIWILFVAVPEELMATGEGTYPLIDEENDELNFSIDLYSGILSGDGIGELWLESLVDDAQLVIEETCDPCTAEDVAECDVCEFSLQALFFGMKIKLDE